MSWQAKERLSSAAKNVNAAIRRLVNKVRQNETGSEAVKAAAVFAKKAGGQAAVFCEYTGNAVVESTSDLRAAAGKSITKAAGTVRKAVCQAGKATKAAACRRCKILHTPFVKMYHAPKQFVEHFRHGGASEAFSYVYCGIRNNHSFFGTIFNYAAPVLGVVVLFNVVTAAMNVTYALDITADGQHVGYVTDEAVLTEAQDMLRQRIIRTADDTSNFEMNPEISVVAVNADLVSDVDDMTDNLIRMSNEDISEAQGLYIDGDFYGAVTDTALIENILYKTLDSYRTGAENETVSFVKDIELRQGLYLTDSIVSSEEMENLLLSNQEAEITYTVVEGDSPILIADKNGIPYSEFKALNPGIEETCLIGQQTLIATEKPFLSVKVTREETYTEDIAYETETTEDNSQYEGYTKTVQEGQNGVREITASVEYVDGYETSREVLSTEVLQEPVTEKIVKGTKQKVSYSTGKVLSASSGSGSYGGSFIWPVGGNGGYISCYYSSGHKAIDIANSYGTNIYASASGTVILAGWYSTYGKAVIIDHGNGVQTLYAHNSSLNVSVGQYVSQGQVIAAMGSTGYSTGNHCHFEIRINGGRYNPLNYLN